MSLVIGINGSPRKRGNTATMIEHALNGAKSKGADIELVHLYDLSFKGCISCFACKRSGGNRSPRCAIKDELTPLLDKIEHADAIFLGSPIYIGDFTSSTRAFIERFLYPQVSYEEGTFSYFKRPLSVGILCTMGASEARVTQAGYDRVPAMAEQVFKIIVGSGESVVSVDTTQFDDYGKYLASRFNPDEKARIHRDQFPKDCAKAFEMGARFASAGK